MGALKVLLDTNVLLWWLNDDVKLQPHVVDVIAERSNQILVSVASLWEILVKVRVRKLEADLHQIEQRINFEGFHRLAIEPPHLAALAKLPFHHRDPFDHLLIAQAISEDATFISGDRMMQKYPVRLL